MEKSNDIINYFFIENQRRFSQETIRGYKISLKQLFAFCQKEYDEVEEADVRAWLTELHSTGLKPKSIRLKLAALKSFYRYCLEEKIIQADPTLNISPLRIVDPIPVYLDKYNLARLRDAAKNHLRDRAVIETLYTTGVRASELLNIRLEDIKWDTGQIWIRKGKGNKERFVLFTNECAERLKLFLANRNIESPYLFANRWGKHFSLVWLEKMFNRYAKELNLGHRFSPHIMRHTFAAHLAEKGMSQSNIQELLGHLDISSTRVYTRLKNSVRKKQYDCFQ